MEKLPPIPTPLDVKWREFRYQYLPLITFFAIIAAVVVMWRQYVLPPNVLAEVEPVTATLISTLPGTVKSLSVDRLQTVSKGQEIARISVYSPDVLAAEVAAVETELEMNKAQMMLDQVRNRQDYERERLSYLQEKKQLVIDRVNLDLAEADFLRESNLWHADPPLTSEAMYDAARSRVQALRVTVEETEDYLAQKQEILGGYLENNTNFLAAVERDIKAQQELLKAAADELILRAPFDGTISAVSNRVGDRVMAGQPIVVISALESSNIVGYVRQPITIVPKVGDLVQVRRQSFKREVGYGRVFRVGTQLEPVNAHLLPANVVEIALPFLVRMESDLELFPGERVDLILNPRDKPVEN